MVGTGHLFELFWNVILLVGAGLSCQPRIKPENGWGFVFVFRAGG